LTNMLNRLHQNIAERFQALVFSKLYGWYRARYLALGGRGRVKTPFWNRIGPHIGRLNCIDTKRRGRGSGAQCFHERTGSHDPHDSLQVIR
jgi:hypothetical protein